jgi:hypothetical protein
MNGKVFNHGKHVTSAATATICTQTGSLDNKGDHGNACHQCSHNVHCSSRKVPVIFAQFFPHTSVSLMDCSKQSSLPQDKISQKSV